MAKITPFVMILLCLSIALFVDLVSAQANVCPGNSYSCEVYQTCCEFGDGNYGCCPYAYANCCKDTNACCQSGFHCQSNGTGCVRNDV